MSPLVQVSWAALRKAWRRAECEELWLQFRPQGSGDVLADVDVAIGAANESVEAEGWGEEVFVGAASDSDAGPVALMSRAGPEPGVQFWFDAFARHLASRGLTGKVTAAPVARFPAWLDEAGDVAKLTAFVAHETDDLAGLEEMERRGGWHVPLDRTNRIAKTAVEWGKFAGAETFLWRDIHALHVRDPDVDVLLASGITRFGQAGVKYLHSAPNRSVTINLSPQGLALYGIMEDATPWQDRLNKVVEAVRMLATDADLAVVRWSGLSASGWSSIASPKFPLPDLREYHVRYNRHLLSEYTPDAHGVQLLTDAHLRHAHDLSDWTVEPVGNRRHLVSASDLEPWFATAIPDPDTVQKARRDFGGMILTTDIIANEPPPWKKA